MKAVILVACVIGAIFLILGTILKISNSQSPNELLSPTPELIECFINGKSVMATRENCQELSKIPTPNQAQPIRGNPALLNGVFNHTTTCYPGWGGSVNCY